jgi:hypothetical protein
MKTNHDLIVLSPIPVEIMQKVIMFIDTANQIIVEYFGIKTSFDIIICQGSWEMEIQVISRRESPLLQYNDTNSIAITDYRLREIIIRHDIARFGHYLHELIHGIIHKIHTQQLREGLAWYFTLRLTEQYRYVRPNYPSWVDNFYIYPVKKLARILGDEFLRDFMLGSGTVQEDALPSDIQELFLPEEFYYAKRRYSS